MHAQHAAAAAVQVWQERGDSRSPDVDILERYPGDLAGGVDDEVDQLFALAVLGHEPQLQQFVQKLSACGPLLGVVAHER